mmetsp:Transcript_9415/g.20657  ORF Transcript_9415/g.20657 Transcript_9415/m.20657 type:complete len:247 (-) Transcript_9415:148-888(-)
MHEGHGVDDLGSQLLRVLAVPLQLLLQIRHSILENRLGIVLPQGLPKLLLLLGVPLTRFTKPPLGPADQLSQGLLELIKMQQVSESQSVANSLRAVGRADPPLGRPNGHRPLLQLQDPVDDLMGVDQDVRPGGDEDAVERIGVELLKRFKLFHQCGHVAHHSVPDDVLACTVNDSAGQQVEGILLPVDHQCVPRIGSTIEAGAHGGVLGQDIHQLPLAFIPPLGSEDHAELRHHGCGCRGRHHAQY